MPGLARLLAVATRTRHEVGVEAQLCQRMGVLRQADWPLAAIKALGQGLQPSVREYWLQAHAVHLVLQRDYFTLQPAEPLSAEESQALLFSLNQHFGADGMLFLPAADHWYLRLLLDPRIVTSPLAQVLGQDTRSHALQGEGAARWDGLLNEMQMLLFQHEVNQVREAARRLPVNSLWLSGGGMLPAPLAPGKPTLFASDALGLGLMELAGQHALPPPEDANALLALEQDDSIMVLDSANGQEQDWFAPLLQALLHHQLKQLQLLLPLHGGSVSFDIGGYDVWKFWRRSKPLHAYFQP